MSRPDPPSADTPESDPPARRTSAGPQRSDAATAAILDAAEAILDEAGYRGFSIEAVARRAGAGKPTVYRWWPTKAALLADVYARQKDRVPALDTGSLEGDLAAMMRTLWELWRESRAGEAFRSIIAEAQSDPQAMAALHDFLAARRGVLDAMLQRAERRGEIAAVADRDLVFDMVFGFNWIRLLTSRIEDDGTIERAARWIRCGLGAGKGQPGASAGD